MKFFYSYFLLSIVFFKLSFSQLLVNGVDFITTDASVVYVNNDSLIIENNTTFIQNGLLRIDKDLISQNGTLINDGDIFVSNDVLINDSIIGVSALSNFYVSGNWVNNHVFEPGLSTVTLNGNVQEIKGTAITSFYNLLALGTLNDKKELINTNISVLNNLNLGDVEFATNSSNLSVLNPNPNSIQRNNGFVSSLDVGRLERATNSTNVYLFPTGSTDNVTRYRPIELKPNSNSANTFGVRLANLDATIDGFDVTLLGDSLCTVNPNFYHNIYAASGSVDITMFYLPAEDGTWNSIAKWQQTDRWDKTPNETNSNAGIFSTVNTVNVNDFSEPEFALSVKKPSLTLNNQIVINSGESALLSPNYTGSTPTNIIWSPLENLSCSNCLETEVSPNQTTLYNIEVEVFENCLLNDSVLVIIKPFDLQFPTAFSPNSDGVNEYYKPVGVGVEEFNMNVYNRWGEKVFTTNDISSGWSGTFKSLNAPVEVYTFVAKYKFKNIDEEKYQSGTFTLIR